MELRPIPRDHHSARRLRPAVLAAVFLASLAVPLVATADACASNHGRVFLTGFEGGFSAASSFYAAREGTNATATVGVTPGDCGSFAQSATYQTADGEALAGQDYTAKSGPVEKLCDDVHGQSFCPSDTQSTRSVDVPTTANNPGPEPVAERFEFRLTSGSAGLATPASAPMYVLDIHGAARASMEPSTPGEPMAYSTLEFAHVLIPVFRGGPGSSGSVHFSVEPDPSSPATPGADYKVVTPSPLTIGSSGVGFIRIDIVGDRIGEGDESLVVALENGPGGVAVVEPSTARFTIIDNEESVVPRSRLHHPRHNLKYKKDDYRIREVHVFATDEGGSGVIASELAIRRNLKNGKCRWLTKGGWKGGGCGERRWLPTAYDRIADLFYYRLGSLKPSVGKGKIADYTAFSRAIDGAENVEREFDEKRNANTFEVKRKKRRKR